MLLIGFIPTNLSLANALDDLLDTFLSQKYITH